MDGNIFGRNNVKWKILFKRIFSLLLSISLVCFPTTNAQPASGVVKVPIVLYHNLTNDPDLQGAPLLNITPENFRVHMQALKDAGFTPIGFDEYYDFATQSAPLPDKPIIISFDDGYATNYTCAYPVLQELEMKATIFVVTDRMGASTEQGVIYPHFSWEDAREMQNSGWIDIESHSDSHGNMLEMPLTDMQRELRRSKYLIEKNLNKECNVMAFPYGGNTTIARSLGTLAGYKILCLVGDVGSNSAGSDVTALRRITIRGDQTKEELLDTISKNLV